MNSTPREMLANVKKHRTKLQAEHDQTLELLNQVMPTLEEIKKEGPKDNDSSHKEACKALVRLFLYQQRLTKIDLKLIEFENAVIEQEKLEGET